MAATIAMLQYVSSGLIFAVLFWHPRKPMFILRALTLQNRVQLFSAVFLTGLYSFSHEPDLALLWGTILCFTIHLSKELSKRAPQYTDHLETNVKVLASMDAISAYIREVGKRNHKRDN
ncbi:hypothetical protein GZH53_17350 [Flavihumibacter sp. R14]|nr:hypothetical protein [Flavihumibacter soli]